MTTTTSTLGKIRRVTQDLVGRLPDDATWDDVHYEVYVCQSIEAGLADCEAGRVLTIAEVRERLGLKP